MFGSKDKEKEHNPVSSFLPLKDKDLRSLQLGRLRETHIAGVEGLKVGTSPRFLAGKFLTLTRKEKDEK